MKFDVRNILDRFRHRSIAPLPAPHHHAPEPHAGLDRAATKAPHDKHRARARQRATDRARMVTRSRGQVIRR